MVAEWHSCAFRDSRGWYSYSVAKAPLTLFLVQWHIVICCNEIFNLTEKWRILFVFTLFHVPLIVICFIINYSWWLRYIDFKKLFFFQTCKISHLRKDIYNKILKKWKTEESFRPPVDRFLYYANNFVSLYKIYYFLLYGFISLY